MSRYFIKPRRAEEPYYEDYSLSLPSVTVHTSQDQAVETGLCDHRGDPIYRAPEAIGFLRRD